MTQQITRFGFLLPAANTTVETEIPPRIGGDHTAHFQRFTRIVRTEADLAETEQAIVDAAQVLRAARVSVMALAYTAGSYYGGLDYDRRVIARVEEETGTRATTAADAIVSALRALGASKVAVVSPYSPDVNEHCQQYLTEAGFQVPSVVGSPPPGPASEVPIDDVAQMVRSAPIEGADALLVSCTALRTMTLIDDLERDLGLPVVSSNSATLWAALRLAGAETRPAGLGALFTRPAAPSRS